MSCQLASVRIREFIERNVAVALKAAEAHEDLNTGYGALRSEAARLDEVGKRCLAIEPHFKEAGMAFPGELYRQVRVTGALVHLFETHRKEADEPSKFGHVWKSAALNSLKIAYGDLSAASRTGVPK
jgi:hypothetical protein